MQNRHKYNYFPNITVRPAYSYRILNTFWSVSTVFLNYLTMPLGCSMAQTVSRYPLTVESRVQRSVSVVIVVDKVALARVPPPST